MKGETLPEELQEIRSFLPEMIGRLEQRLPYVSALVTEERGSILNIDTRQERIMEKAPQRGIVFTLFNGRFFQEWATDRLEEDFLKDKTDEMCGLFEKMEDMEPRFEVKTGEEKDEHYDSEFETDPDDVKLEEMVTACRDLIGTVESMEPRIANTTVSYHDGKEYKIFANRKKLLSSSLTTCGIRLVVIGTHKKRTRMNFIGSGGVAGFEAIKFKKESLQEMIDDLNLLFESEPPAPGIYDVISSPEVSGILAHEAFGHGVETDMMVKKRSRAASYMNKRVASSLVDMIDDPSLKGLNGSYFFDDEGQIARPTVIIKNGVLKRGLTDLRSAMEMGLERSANGRRESFERKIYARMSNTFFDSGESSFEEMLGDTDYGLYLKKSSSGMEDPQGWGIQVGINLAREIKNGKLTSRVYSPLTMTGYVPDLLQSVTHVGNRVEFAGMGGTCGKGHKELVRVSAGGPHLRFKVRLG